MFDSGVGGLTVAHALHTLLPSEKLIYFGDTAHLPYGDKSKETIVRYSLGISDFLLKQKCKLILIACNSASSNAYEEVKEHVGDRAVVLNVIDPVVEHVCLENVKVQKDDRSRRVQGNNYDTGNRDSSRAARRRDQMVGIIGTKATIDSGTYQRKIDRLNSDLQAQDPEMSEAGHAPGSSIQVSSLATPLLVPMIEEGFVFDDISNAIIRAYLSRKEMEGIDSLILGCTHYPIIRNQISRFFNFEVNVLDTAQIVAQAVRRYLSQHDLLSTQKKGGDLFYVSDHTPYFETIANMFFNEKIHLERKDIWK